MLDNLGPRRAARFWIGLVAGLVMATQASAQAGLPELREFDCADTIREFIAPQPGAPLEWVLPGATVPHLIANASDIELPSGNNFVSARETDADVIFRGAFDHPSNTGVVGCALIAVRFEGNRIARTIHRDREHPQSNNGSVYLPILLMKEFPSLIEYQRAFELWRSESYNIQLYAADHFETTAVEPEDLRLTAPGAAIPLGAYLIGPIEYMGNSITTIGDPLRPRQAQVVFQSLEGIREPAIFEDFGLPTRSLANIAMVICGPADCGAMLPLPERGTSTLRQIVVAPAVGPSNGTAAANFTPVSPDAASAPEPEPSPVPEVVAAPEADPVVEVVADAVAPAPASPPPAAIGPQTVTLRYNDVDNLLSVERITCLLHHLGTRMDPDAVERCDDPSIQAVAEASQLSIQSVDQWALSPRAVPQPSQLIVVLPDSVQAASCGLDAFVVSPDGGVSREIALDPPVDPATRGARFVALWPRDIPVGPAGIEILLNPSNPAGCGGPARTVRAEPGEILEVSLVEDSIALAEVVHLTAFLASDLSADLAMTTALQDALSEQIYAAVGAAHIQLSRVYRTTPSPISAVSFGHVGRDGSPNAVSLPANRLAGDRDITEAIFAAIEQVGLGHTATNGAGALRRGLAALAVDAQMRGASRLHVNLFGPLVPRSTADPAALCDDFRILQETVDLQTVIPVTLTAYLLVAMDPDAQYNLQRLTPVTLPQGAERLPSGLMTCSDMPAGIAIVPFFNEDWRSPRDLPARFGTAIGDHVAQFMVELARNLEDPS